MSVNIAVFVSGGGTNLQALINAGQSGQLHSGRIALVLSSRSDAYALERAKQANIPALVVSRKHASDQAVFEQEILRALLAYQIDLIVLAGFMHILSSDFVSRYPRRILNVHPSLIPSFCGEGFYGLKVHQAALDYGVKVSGATVHFVNEIPDGGEILLQKAVPVLDGDTPQLLQKRIMEQAEWKLLPAAVALVCNEIQITGEAT